MQYLLITCSTYTRLIQNLFIILTHNLFRALFNFRNEGCTLQSSESRHSFNQECVHGYQRCIFAYCLGVIGVQNLTCIQCRLHFGVNGIQ